MEMRLSYGDLMSMAEQLENTRSELDGVWFDFGVAGGYGPSSRAMKEFVKKVQVVAGLRSDYCEFLENDIQALKRAAFLILMQDVLIGHMWSAGAHHAGLSGAAALFSPAHFPHVTFPSPSAHVTSVASSYASQTASAFGYRGR